LQGVGGTIAVLGTGLDQTYPKRNARLRPQVIDQGAIITEFPIYTPPKRENFPQRNRIISGLALGVLVVEADVRSGSLITARQALDQGRDVFAIPGSIHNPLARGCHQLIQQGAKLTSEVSDILIEIEPQVRCQMEQLFQTVPSATTNPSVTTSSSVSSQKQTDLFDADLSDVEQAIIDALGYERSDIDSITAHVNFSVPEIMNGIFMLELKGMVESVPGGYCRTSV